MDQSISFFLTQILSEIFLLKENEKHIQAGILSGSLSLENLVIKKSLLDDEKFPMTLCHGSIGKIFLRFPWSNLGNEPIQIIIENIFVLCKPEYKRDSMEMKLRREHRRKRARLGTLDAMNSTTIKQQSSSSSSAAAAASVDPKEKSFMKSLPSLQYFTRYLMEKMISSLLKNIQIEIHNFHFRYEDQISCQNEIAIGFTLESFTLQSINESFANSSFGILYSLFSSGHTQPIYQRCTMNSVSMYLNQLVMNTTPIATATTVTSDIGFHSFADKSTPEILLLMERSIPTKYRRANTDVVSRGRKHEYLIQPFHTSCEIEICLGTYDEGGNLLTNDIQINAEAVTTDIAIHLEDKQVKALNELIQSITVFNEVDKFSIYRPSITVKQNPKSWWRYAINAVRDQLDHFSKPKFTEASMNEYFRRKNLYCELWKRCLYHSDLNWKVTDIPRYSNSMRQLETALLNISYERKKYRKIIQEMIYQSSMSEEQQEDESDQLICPISYDKLAPIEKSLLISLEEQLTSEIIYFFRCLSEYQLFIECRNRIGNSNSSYQLTKSLFQQAQNVLFDGLGGVLEVKGKKEKDKLSHALSLLEPSYFKNTKEGNQRKTKKSQGAKSVSTPNLLGPSYEEFSTYVNPLIQVKCIHKLEKVSVTLSLSPIQTCHTSALRSEPIPFLCLNLEEFLTTLTIKTHLDSSDPNLFQGNFVSDYLKLQLSMQDLEVLELLPIPDNSHGISLTGSAYPRSQASSIFSSFRRHKSRKLLYRPRPFPNSGSIIIENSSPFNMKAKSDYPLGLFPSSSEAIQPPLLQISLNIPLPVTPIIPSQLTSIGTVSITFNELQLFISPSIKELVKSFGVFFESTSPRNDHPSLPSQTKNSNKFGAPDIKYFIDQGLQPFTEFNLPLVVEISFLPIQIIFSDIIEGNELLPQPSQIDETESVGTSGCFSNDGLFLIMSTGTTKIKLEQKEKASMSVDPKVRNQMYHSCDICTEDISIAMLDQSTLSLSKNTQPNFSEFALERKFLLKPFSIHTTFEIESRLMETYFDPIPLFGTESKVRMTSFLSMKSFMTPIEVFLSENKVLLLLKCLSNFCATDAMESLDMSLKGSEMLTDHAVWGSSQNVFEEKNGFVDDFDNCDFSETKESYEAVKTPSSEPSINSDENDDDDYFSADEELDEFKEVIEPQTVEQFSDQDNDSMMNHLEITLTSLDDEIQDLKVEQVAISTQIRINNSDSFSSRLVYIENRLKSLRSEYVETSMELDARKRQVQVEQLMDLETHDSLPSVQLKTQVTEYLKSLSESIVPSSTQVEKERKHLLSLYKIRNVMNNFQPVSKQRKERMKRIKFWRKNNPILLNLNLSFPSITFHFFGNDRSISLDSTPTLSLPEELLFRCFIHDYQSEITHSCNEFQLNTTIQNVSIINDCLLHNHNSNLDSTSPLVITQTYGDYLLMKFLPTIGNQSPRSHHSKPSPVIRFHYRLKYGGNILKPLNQRLKFDQHKIFSHFDLIEIVPSETLLLSLLNVGKALSHNSPQFLFSKGNLPKRDKNSDKPLMEPKFEQQVELFEFFLTQWISVDYHFAGMIVKFPLLMSSFEIRDYLSIGLTDVKVSTKNVDQNFGYEVNLGNISSTYHQTSWTTIDIFSKDQKNIQPLLTANGNVGLFWESQNSSEHRLKLKIESLFELSNINVLISPSTFVSLLQHIETSSFLEIMKLSKKPKEATIVPPLPSDQQPPDLILPVSTFCPLKYIRRLIDNSYVNIHSVTGNLNILLVKDEDILQSGLDWNVQNSLIRLGYHRIEQSLVWGNLNEFEGVEFIVLLKDLQMTTNLNGTTLDFISPFNVSSVTTLTPPGLVMNCCPPQSLLSTFSHNMKSLSRVGPNSTDILNYVTPIRIQFSESSVNAFSKWFGENLHQFQRIHRICNTIQHRIIPEQRSKESVTDQTIRIDPLGNRDAPTESIALNANFSVEIAEISTVFYVQSIESLSIRPAYPTPLSGKYSGEQLPSIDCLGAPVCIFRTKNLSTSSKIIFSPSSSALTNHFDEPQSSTPSTQIPFLESRISIYRFELFLLSSDDFDKPAEGVLDSLVTNSSRNELNNVIDTTIVLTSNGKFNFSTAVRDIHFIVNADVLTILAHVGFIYCRSISEMFDSSKKADEIPSLSSLDPSEGNDSFSETELNSTNLYIDSHHNFVFLQKKSFALPDLLSDFSVTFQLSSCGLWVPAGSSCRFLDRPRDCRALFLGFNASFSGCHHLPDFIFSSTDHDLKIENTFWTSNFGVSDLRCYITSDFVEELTCPESSLFDRLMILHPLQMNALHSLYIQQSYHGHSFVMQDISVLIDPMSLSIHLDYRPLIDIFTTSFLPFQKIAEIFTSPNSPTPEADGKIGIPQTFIELENPPVLLASPPSHKRCHFHHSANFFLLIPSLIHCTKTLNLFMNLETIEVTIWDNIMVQSLPLLRVKVQKTTTSGAVDRPFGDLKLDDVGLLLDASLLNAENIFPLFLIGSKLSHEIEITGLTVDYNNFNLMDWESLMSPLDISLTVSAPLLNELNVSHIFTSYSSSVIQKSRIEYLRNSKYILQDSLPTKSILKIEVDSCIYIHLKKSFITLMTSFVSSLDSLKNLDDRMLLDRGAYFIVNKTGLPLFCDCFNHQTQSSELIRDDLFFVPLNGNLPLPIGLGLFHQARYLKIMTEVKDEMILICDRLPIFGPGFYSFYFQTHAHQTFEIIVEVSIDSAGLTQILIRSSLEVVNDYTSRMEINLMNHSQIVHSFILDVGDTANIPALFLPTNDDVYLSLRPHLVDSYSPIIIPVPSIENLTGAVAEKYLRTPRDTLAEQNDVAFKIVKNNFFGFVRHETFHNSRKWRISQAISDQISKVPSRMYGHWINYPHSNAQSCNLHVSMMAFGLMESLPTQNSLFMNRTMRFSAPLTFVNALPDPISIVVYSGKCSRRNRYRFPDELEINDILKKMNGVHFTLNSGDKYDCQRFHCSEDVTFCLQIQTPSLGKASAHDSSVSDWSTMLFIPGSSTSTSNHPSEYFGKITLPSNNNSTLDIQVTLCDDLGRREIELYVPFWILTYSSHSLFFQHDLSSVRENPSEERVAINLNGNDDLAADQTLIDFSKFDSLHVPRSDETLSFKRNQSGRVAAFSGEEISQESFIHEKYDELEMASHRPYRLMMCGWTTQNLENSREDATHLRFRINESQWSSSFKLTHNNSKSEIVKGKSSSKNAGKSTVSRVFGSNPFGAPMISDQVSEFVLKSKTLPSPFHRTTLVMLMDRYVFVNLTGQSIRVKQHGCNNIYDVDDKDKITISWRLDKPKVFQIRLSAHGWLYSGRISCLQTETTTLLLRNGLETDLIYLVECSIVNSNGFVHVIIKTANFISPYRIENRTKTAIRFHQVDISENQTILKPYHACSYSWDEPTLAKQLYFEKNRSPPTSSTIGSSEWITLGKFSFEKPMTQIITTNTTVPVEIKIERSGPTHVLCIQEIQINKTLSMRSPKKISQSRSELLLSTSHSQTNLNHSQRPQSLQKNSTGVPFEFTAVVSNFLFTVSAPSRCSSLVSRNQSFEMEQQEELISILVKDIFLFANPKLNETKSVGLEMTISHIEVTGLVPSSPSSDNNSFSRVGIFYKARLQDQNQQPFLRTRIEVDQQYPRGVISLPLLHFECAPVMIHFNESLLRRIALLVPNLFFDKQQEKFSNKVNPPFEISKEQAEKVITELFAGTVKHNLYIAFRSSDHDSDPSKISLADIMIASELLKYQYQKSSSLPAPKLYLQNVYLSSLSYEITGNIELVSSLSASTKSVFHDDNSRRPGGMKGIIQSLQNCAILFARVFTNSAIKYGKIPIQIDSVEIPLYFGDPETLVMELMSRYQTVIARQISQFLTMNSIGNTLKSLTNYASLCFISTASDVLTVTQLMLHGAAEETVLDDEKGRSEKDGQAITFETTDVMLRTQTKRIRVPTSLIDGTMRSIAGLYQDPLVGLKKNGALGLATGILKAAIGLPLRPAYGLFHQFQEVLVALSRPYLRDYAPYGHPNVSSYITTDTPVLFHEECHLNNDPETTLYCLYATSEEMIICHVENISRPPSSFPSHHQICHQICYSHMLTFEFVDVPVIQSTEGIDHSFIEIEIHNRLVCIPLGDQQLTKDEGEGLDPSPPSSHSQVAQRNVFPKYGLRLEYTAHNQSHPRQSLVVWFDDSSSRSEFQKLLSTFSPRKSNLLLMG